MANQQTLFEMPPPKLTPEERFLKFHKEHSEIYWLLCVKARQVRDAGHKKYSIRTIWDILRWESDIRTGEQPYNLNDHYSPFYARLIMKQEKDLKGFFETREQWKNKTSK